VFLLRRHQSAIRAPERSIIVTWWLQSLHGGEREKPVSRSIEPEGAPANAEPVSIPALESTLALALQGSLSRDEVKTAVYAFTDEHRRNGEPVEKILVPLKEAVAHARALSWRLLTSPGQAATADDVAATVVRCCIEHFYDNSINDVSPGDLHAPPG
jgi:hypothetical protein